MRSTDLDHDGTRTISGQLDTTANYSGPGWRSVRNAAGDITIYFVPSFRAAPSIECTSLSTGGGSLPRVTERDQNHIRVVNNAGATEFTISFVAKGLA